MLKAPCADDHYVTLDNPIILNEVTNEPSLFLKKQ